MSRTANRPKGASSENFSTHIGFEGIMVTIAASPLLTIFGLSSSFLPDRRSIFSFNSAICTQCESVAIQYRCIASVDFTGVVHDNNLSKEVLGFLRWVVLAVTGNHSSLDVLD